MNSSQFKKVWKEIYQILIMITLGDVILSDFLFIYIIFRTTIKTIECNFSN